MLVFTTDQTNYQPTPGQPFERRAVTQEQLDFHNFMRASIYGMAPVQEFLLRPAIEGSTELGPPVICYVEPAS